VVTTRWPAKDTPTRSRFLLPFPFLDTHRVLLVLTYPFSPPRTTGAAVVVPVRGRCCEEIATGRSCCGCGGHCRARPWSAPSRHQPAQPPPVTRCLQVSPGRRPFFRPRACRGTGGRRSRILPIVVETLRGLHGHVSPCTGLARLGPFPPFFFLFFFPTSTWIISRASPKLYPARPSGFPPDLTVQNLEFCC
jgi:hypothetical protein